MTRGAKSTPSSGSQAATITSSAIPADATVNSAKSPSDQESDHWLDSLPQPVSSSNRVLHTIVHETFGQPLFFARRLWSFLSTSPGRLTMVTVVISVAIIAAGVAMSVSSDTRQKQLDQLITNTEPVAFNAHLLYTNLSLADTTATTAFAQEGVESPEVRSRYYDAVDTATIATTRTAAAANPNDEELMNLVTEVQRQLPVYIGLVETARTNNRAGNPVGAAYLAEANSLMRFKILPLAADLYKLTARDVADQQAAVTKPQWVPLSGLVAAIIMLGAAQWWLMRITRRRINRGFATATLLMFVATFWVSTANLAAWNAGTQGFEEAVRPLNSLTTARIYAQQTRTTETLALVRRQSVQGSNNGFNMTVNQINSAVDRYAETDRAQTADRQELIEQLRQGVQSWEIEHDQFTAAVAAGNYNAATTAVLTPGGGKTSFITVDDSLSALINDSRLALRSYLQTSLSAANKVSSAVLILSLLATVSIWLGIRPRLQEYL